MKPEDCEKHARDCIAKAAKSPIDEIALEFKALAAQWRAIAAHKLYFFQEKPYR
jgi:hypothetical protein